MLFPNFEKSDRKNKLNDLLWQFSPVLKNWRKGPWHKTVTLSSGKIGLSSAKINNGITMKFVKPKKVQRKHFKPERNAFLLKVQLILLTTIETILEKIKMKLLFLNDIKIVVTL